ncbi:MAG: hypothetical protein GTN64_00165, partial [Candidatus Latescibacteria bacterium]|nr:hypothetical protein [Candidatus Latescibacterota bacterium]NIO77033.1 hypothetical protein [Candidatus Latescibacterota bacterium]
LSALVLAFKDEESTEETYDIFPFFWMPAPTIEKRLKKDKRIRYDIWVKNGFIKTTPGPVTDYAFIRQFILDEILGKYELAQIWYDPAEATQLAIELEEATGNEEFMVKCLQYAKNLHEATVMVEKLATSKNLRHGDDPILRWMNSNVQIRTDSEGHIKIDKAKSSQKVDGMTALVNAFKGWI